MTEENTKTEVITADVAFAQRWEKSRKVVAGPNDDQQAFGLFIQNTFDDSNPYKDWASKPAAKYGQGNFTLVMVETEEGEARLIAVAAPELVMGTGGDMVARQALYRMFVNRAAGIAGKTDSVEDMFSTIAGFLKPRFDLEAFKFSARDVVKVLHSKGLHGITVPTLKIALSNAAFAAAQFPMMKPEQWKVIFAIMRSKAVEASLDVSILDHWINNRDSMTAAGADIDLGGEEGLLAALEDEDEGDASAS